MVAPISFQYKVCLNIHTESVFSFSFCLYAVYQQVLLIVSHSQVFHLAGDLVPMPFVIKDNVN